MTLIYRTMPAFIQGIASDADDEEAEESALESDPDVTVGELENPREARFLHMGNVNLI